MKIILPTEEEMVTRLSVLTNDEFIGLRHVWNQLSLTEKQIMFLIQVEKVNSAELRNYFLSDIEKQRIKNVIERIRKFVHIINNQGE